VRLSAIPKDLIPIDRRKRLIKMSLRYLRIRSPAPGWPVVAQEGAMGTWPPGQYYRSELL
jgi:hypothetical protein